MSSEFGEFKASLGHVVSSRKARETKHLNIYKRTGPMVVVHTFSPSTWEAEAGGSP